MIVAAAICAAVGLVALGALLALVGANHHPHPEPALHQSHYRPWTEDERAWDLQLTGRDNPWPFDQTVD